MKKNISEKIQSSFFLNLVLKLSLSIFIFSSSNAEEKIKLALNWKPEPQFGGFYQAQIDGQFKNQKLNVEIIEGGSGTPTIQMLANEKIEFGIVSGEEILISNERNPKNKVVALFAVYQTSPVMIMAHAEKKFKSIKDVFQSEGHLAMQSGLTYAQYLMKKFQPYKTKVVPYLGGITNFQKDPDFSQQGFITSEPLLAAEAGLKVSTFLVADEGFNPYNTVLAVNENYMKKNPEIVKKITAATRDGWTSYLKNPREANKFMASLNKSMPLETMKKSADLQVKLIQNPKAEIGRMTEARWKQLGEQLVDLKVIKNKPDLHGLFAN